MWIANRDGFVAQSIGSGKLPFQYLTFTAQEANSAISMVKWSTSSSYIPPAVSIETSINNGKTWVPFTIGTTTITLANIGDKVLFRAGDGGTGGDGINNSFSNSSEAGNKFVIATGKVAASGDISSILNRYQSVSTLNSYAFQSLFSGCTKLTSAPELPATTLADSCYYSMFNGCTSLTTAPTLPATTLAARCYYYMFQDCTSLTSAPALPATTLASYCYSYMFLGCTSLTSAPELPATTLDSYCYASMFRDCTSLISAPELPATTLDSYCYASMFRDCTSLISAPTLPAPTLTSYCYSYMFYGCTSLNNISVEFTSWVSGATNSWVSGVSQSGTFECPAELSHTSSDFGTSKIPTGWTVNSPYWGLTFTAREPNSVISMAKSGTPPAVSLETSIDTGNTWYPFTIGTTTITLTNVGDKVYFRAGDNGTGGNGINNAFASEGTYNYFVISSGKIAASGDISSILNRNQSVSILNSFAFSELFYGCVNLTNAPRLPAITLASYCYVDMFSGCTSLTTAPELPATTLADLCYAYMFYGCTSLTTAPALPATTLASADYCYIGMFEGCTSITTAPSLPATTLADYCYHGMFSGCTSLTTAPELPATTLTNYCYRYMFSGCTSLTAAPELPAPILTSQCYSGMFSGCSNLASISVKFVVWESSSTVDWVLGVKESGTFTCLTVLPHGSGNFGNSKIPTGWTVAEGSYHGVPIIAYFEQAGKAQNEFSVDANAIVTIKGAGFTQPNIISAKFGKLEAGGNSFAYAFNPTAITVIDANTVTCKVSAAEDPDQTDEQLAADSAAGLIVLRLFTQMTRSVNDLIAHYVQA